MQPLVVVRQNVSTIRNDDLQPVPEPFDQRYQMVGIVSGTPLLTISTIWTLYPKTHTSTPTALALNFNPRLVVGVRVDLDRRRVHRDLFSKIGQVLLQSLRSRFKASIHQFGHLLKSSVNP